jgi:hypothetical protein
MPGKEDAHMPRKAKTPAPVREQPATVLSDIDDLLSFVAEHPEYPIGQGYLDEAEFNRLVVLDRAVGKSVQDLGLTLPARPNVKDAHIDYLPHTGLRYYRSRPGTSMDAPASGPSRPKLAPSQLWLAEMRAIRQEAEAVLANRRSPKPHKKIPPEHRTRPMTMGEAARLMGYSRTRDTKAAVKTLRAAIDSDSIACERLSRQSYIFSRLDFPKEVWPKLTPTDPNRR